MNKLRLSHLRLKKIKEVIRAHFDGCVFFNKKTGNIRYGRNLIDFVFRPNKTSLLEFCMILFNQYNVEQDFTIESTIDIVYSMFILEKYNIIDKGADFKFNTIRNLFKHGFRTRTYMINHYSHKLSLPIIRILKKEFEDLDILNIVVPERVSVLGIIREFETGIYNHIMKDFALLRAGPYHIRSPLKVAA
jgi:hypothetical protein